ncbi:hypothetical protein Pcinc_010078 [Petrolisthes cinctipes]|uniref:Uncharacterized protein n=1 Tax=Petrolisthes cinctipes TaxID=88211 RepID=A0AAE1G5L9_PETCI|nr:hypothetical protein Pcinc_010078 [Petrolisthes cinctipes]
MAKVNAKRNVYLAMVSLTFIVYQVTLYHYQNDIPTFTKNIPPASLLSAYNTISVTAHPFVVATRLKERRDRMRKACGEVDHPKTISNTLARILYAPSHDMFVCASPKIAKLIAKSKKSHNIGVSLITPSILCTAELVLGKDSENKLSQISLSNETVKGKIDELSQDIKDQTLDQVRASPVFAI